MPAEEERKIMKHGTSGVIAIPMSYRRYHNLKTGTKVRVLYDSLMLIVPEGMDGILEDKRELVNELLGNQTQKQRAIKSRKERKLPVVVGAGAPGGEDRQ
jgi:antitoxin component of MazEF toxin-antitoxin module